jgi:hypothetical protein
MRRRDFLKSGAVLAGASTLAARPALADVPDHLWEGYNFGCPQVRNRLDQGPFGITQDDGWYTIFVTQPSRNHIRNFGTGSFGYTWEENGPALTVQCGQETLEQAVEKMAALPSWTCSISAARSSQKEDCNDSNHWSKWKRWS